MPKTTKLGVISLPSQLTKANVMTWYEHLHKQIAINSEICIDCQAVEQIDSAGVAMLLELKHATATNTITFSNIPDSISALCQLYQIQL